MRQSDLDFAVFVGGFVQLAEVALGLVEPVLVVLVVGMPVPLVGMVELVADYVVQQVEHLALTDTQVVLLRPAVWAFEAAFVADHQMVVALVELMEIHYLSLAAEVHGSLHHPVELVEQEVLPQNWRQGVVDHRPVLESAFVPKIND